MSRFFGNSKILKSSLDRRRNVLTCQYHCKTGVYGYQAQVYHQRQDELAKEVSSINFESRNKNPNLFRLVEAYRAAGHTIAKTNPVTAGSKPNPWEIPYLNPERYSLHDGDHFDAEGILHGDERPNTLSDIISYLVKTYCGTVALDITCVEDELERDWLCKRHETIQKEELTGEERKRLAVEMLKSQHFDKFLASKFPSVKRYGGEGAEGMMGFFVEVLAYGGRYDLDEVIIGIAHRGRLNLLTGMLNFPPVAMFRKMKGLPEFPPDQQGAGDVLSHLTSSTDLPGCGKNGGDLHVTMLPNPSHLEAVNPVAAGKVRGRHMTQSLGDYSKGENGGVTGRNILCVQAHGDAAVAGQGINQETLALSNLPHFQVGGSLHLVVDNQVGFTTPGERGRSSRYSSDVGRLVGAPSIHVNGDNPEDVMRATRLAMEYRHKFFKDVFVEVHVVRRWGHNELDDPTFTNPALYQFVDSKKSVPDEYVQKLVKDGIVTQEELNSEINEHVELLDKDHESIDSYQPKRSNLKKQWSSMVEPDVSVSDWETGLPLDTLKYVGAKSVDCRDGFSVHKHLKKHHVDARLKKLESGAGLEWGLCEALAIGSLLYQGFNVRISGQDVGRATFSHRHAMLVDQTSNEMHIPFNNMADGNDNVGRLEIANSPLSEEAVLGFEYGISVESPKNLVIWEAQFGDFFNGAQIILDTFVSNGESKWGLQSGLTILLPHGLDGAGPEHSSCRLERFLQMTDSKETLVDGDNVNWQVVNPSTSAQYFHLLRRQMIRNFRKPLVVVAPKILLRLPAASSCLSEMGPGTSFRPVLPGKETVNPSRVKKIIFVSGKHYYALSNHAKENGINDVAFVRLEQLCPFPTKTIQEEMKKYINAKTFVWSQEEHRNAGAWSFVQPRLKNMCGINNLKYAGRSELCQPAVGVASVHKEEEANVLNMTFSF